MTQRPENPEMNPEMNLNEMNPTDEQLEELLRREINQTNRNIKIKHKHRMLDVKYYRDGCFEMGVRYNNAYNYTLLRNSMSFFKACVHLFFTQEYNIYYWANFMTKFKKKFKTLNSRDDLKSAELNNYILSKIENDRFKIYMNRSGEIDEPEITKEMIKNIYYDLFNYPNYKKFKNQLL